ncbi:Late embryogenesis abundant protein [Macleaya cordata]|uniref:Late embryogenesis abundant protein n=1 Tax=Macleaya cordata TaxID=56857 RepID=A0A200R0G4_MACCD|nr:Late embryogenesis abundant protein [Macleaya cordata]
MAHPVKLTKIHFGVFPVLRLNVTLALVVTINNRNYASFKYKNTTTYVTYRGNVVAEAPIESDDIRARSKHNISTSVEIFADKLVLDPHFWIDLSVGSLNFTTSTTLEGKVNLFKILKLHATTSSTCDISLFVKSQTVDSICNSKTKL